MNSLDSDLNKLKQKMKDPGVSFEENLSTVEALLASQPNSPDLICLKADIYYEMAGVQDMSGKEKPIDLYRKALSIDGNSYEAVTKLASYMYTVLEDYPGALPYFEKSISLKVDADIINQYADALANLDRTEEAISIIEKSALEEVVRDQIIREIREEYM